jgi:hypothetical protein
MEREDGELAFETFPGIYREEAIMLLREFYMQTNQSGLMFQEHWLMTAPNPKSKANREKKSSFDEFVWEKYISDERLVKAISTVYGVDPRDQGKFRALLEDWKVDGQGPGVSSNLKSTCVLV